MSLLGSCQAIVWVRVGSEKFFKIYSFKLIDFILKIFLFSDFLIYFVLGVDLSLFGFHRVKLEMGSEALLGLYSYRQISFIS